MNYSTNRLNFFVFVFVFAFVFLVCGANCRHCDSSNRRVVTPHSEVDDCFAVYTQTTRLAATEYVTNYEACFQRRQRQRQLTLEHFLSEKSPERQEVENAGNLVCQRLRDCNSLSRDMEFFQCHAGVGPSNVHSLLTVKFTSSAAMIDLAEDQEVTEKEILLCTIEAQRIYAEKTTEAYQELAGCLKGSNGNDSDNDNDLGKVA